MKIRKFVLGFLLLASTLGLIASFAAGDKANANAAAAGANANANANANAESDSNAAVPDGNPDAHTRAT